MYIEISEMCLIIISPLLKKKYIAIHIDIELLSSPSYKYNKVGKKILQKFLILG